MVNIKRLMRDNSITQRTMAEIMGCTQSEVSFFANGKRELGKKHIDALVSHFGETVINRYMALSITPIVQSSECCRECDGGELIEVDGIPILSEEVATQPEQDIRKYIEECSSELEQVNPNELLKRADLAEKILHTSMLPTFQPEDIVFIRFIPSQMEIVDGNTYYIDSKKYPTLIRRIKVLEEGNLRLTAQNKQFADIVIHRDDINNIGAIVGMLRMNFGNQYDEIEALRAQKDEALAHRDTQMDKIIENQSKLIDYITKTK